MSSVKGRMHSGISIGAGKVSPRARFCLIYVLNILYGKILLLRPWSHFATSHTTAEITILLDKSDWRLAFGSDWLANTVHFIFNQTHSRTLAGTRQHKMLSSATLKPVLSSRIFHMQDTNGDHIAGGDLGNQYNQLYQCGLLSTWKSLKPQRDVMWCELG